MRLLYIGVYPVFVFQLLFQGPHFIYFFLLVLWLSRNFLSATYFLKVLKYGIKKLGFFKGTLGLFYSWLGLVFRDSGRVLESMRWLLGKRINLTQSMGTIIQEVSK